MHITNRRNNIKSSTYTHIHTNFSKSVNKDNPTDMGKLKPKLNHILQAFD